MHIGQFSDSFLPIVDGVGRVVANYAGTIAQKGYPCTVVAPMVDAGYRGGWPFEVVDFLSFAVPTQRQYSSGVPLIDPHYDARMRMTKLDIVHAHSPFIAGQEAIRIARKRHIPLVGTFHSRYYDDFYKLTRAEMLADIAVRFVVSFYEKCDEVWTVSNNSAETLHDYGYRGEITVIPNGTPDASPDEARARAARERFGLGERPVLFYCGQMNWKKNILLILDACARMKSRGTDFTLVMTGQGPDEKAIESKAAQLGLEERVVFTGHLTDDQLLYGLYQSASLFVFPSLYDTSGMVVHEAAAMGTPSVVAAGSAPAEPVRDGENGLITRNDPDDLARVIQRALSDPQKLDDMGRNARSTIYLSWDTIIDRVLERYQGLVDAFSK